MAEYKTRECENMKQENPTLTFYHVSLHPDQQIGLHRQQSWELSYIIHGSGVRTLGSVHEPFSSSDAVLIAPEVSHQWLFDSQDTDESGNIENITISFPRDMLHQLAEIIPEYVPLASWYDSIGTALVFAKPESEVIGDALLQMQSQPHHLRIAQLLQVLSDIFEHHHLTPLAGSPSIGQFSTKASSDSRIQKIEVFLACNYQRKVNLEDLASHVGLNRSSLCTYFKQRMGKTIMQYLIDLRLTIAKQLLESDDLSIAQCCYKSGFNDIPHFNRTFKRSMGITPNEYRAKKKEESE